MKKRLLAIITMMFITSVIATANAATNKEVANAIKLYKNGNYAECYTNLKDYVKKDSSNVIAYYYLAMSSVQVGQNNEAVSNYQKVLNLAPKNSNIYRYATQGKICIETPDKCEKAIYTSPAESFILNNTGENFSKEVKGKYEQLKIENLMREINRSNSISPDKFKEYKDFSSSSLIPSLVNDEFLNSDSGLDYNPINSQLIQAMLTNNMTLGF